MNLLMTTVCNRRCKYCFAMDKVDYRKLPSGNQYISLDNFNKALSYFIDSNEKISLLGGEPTIHPQFPEIIKFLRDRQIPVNIFTNGIMPKPSLNALAATDPAQFHLTVNVNEPHENKKEEWRRILGLFEMLPDHVGLGFNIYNTDFDPGFIIDLCNEYKLTKTVRLGLAQPIINTANAFIDPSFYKVVGKKIVDLSEKADRHDISLGFDCGFVFCMFTESQIGRLTVNNVRLKFVCGPAIDIGPDLSVWSCFPLSRIHNTRLEDYKSLKDIVKFYTSKLQPLFQNGIYDKCARCKFLFRKQCHGGCAAHIYNKSIGN
ncbi:MAG: radical SAM/SPASM domain-containing protein [Syntrophobacteraceae bacterium]